MARLMTNPEWLSHTRHKGTPYKGQEKPGEGTGLRACDLLTDLQLVAPGLARKKLIEQATSFMFISGKVCTYNDEVSVSKKAVGVEIDGAVQAEKLIGLLSKLGKKEIKLSIKQGEEGAGELLITTKRARAGLRIEHEIQLPIESVGEPKQWHKVPDNLFEAVSFCLFATSTDQTRPILTCVHVRDNYVEACDNYRGIRYKLKSRMPSKVNDLLIPNTVAKDLRAYNVKKVGHTKEWTHFMCDGDIHFAYRRMVEEFPDLTPQLSVKGTKLSFPKLTPQMIEVAGVFSGTDIGADEFIEVSIKDNRMMIHGYGELGWYKEQSLCNYSGTPFRFLIQPHFLVEILAHTNKAVVSDRRIKMQGDKFVYVAALVVTDK